MYNDRGLCWCFELFLFWNPVVKGIPIKQWYAYSKPPPMWTSMVFFENFEKSAAGHHPCPRLDGAEGAWGDPLSGWFYARIEGSIPQKKGSFQQILGTHKELARLMCLFVLGGGGGFARILCWRCDILPVTLKARSEGKVARIFAA